MAQVMEALGPIIPILSYVKTQRQLVDGSGEDWCLGWSYPKPEDRESWVAPNLGLYSNGVSPVT